MKKTILLLIVIFILVGCNNDPGEYIYYYEATENLTERLEDAKVPFIIKDDKIYILEGDLNKATRCCS